MNSLISLCCVCMIHFVFVKCYCWILFAVCFNNFFPFKLLHFIDVFIYFYFCVVSLRLERFVFELVFNVFACFVYTYVMVLCLILDDLDLWIWRSSVRMYLRLCVRYLCAFNVLYLFDNMCWSCYYRLCYVCLHVFFFFPFLFLAFLRWIF